MTLVYSAILKNSDIMHIYFLSKYYPFETFRDVDTFKVGFVYFTFIIVQLLSGRTVCA